MVPPVGSGISTASARKPRSRVASAPLPVLSSSVTVWRCTSPPGAKPAVRSASMAKHMAETPAFMSCAPRPYIQPSFTVAP
jgi:hypothetical protein